jgi:hypothetical protein
MVFSHTKKSQFRYILEAIGMANVGIFDFHLEYFTAICDILLPFGIFCGNLVCFPVWYVVHIKIWQPCRDERITP